MECLFKSLWECQGKLKEISYDKPCEYWNWPEIYICNNHLVCTFDWKDALNSKSNLIVQNIKMTHSKELSPLQGMEYFTGWSQEIIFCDICKGTGEIGYSEDIRNAQPCIECNCTGRKK